MAGEASRELLATFADESSELAQEASRLVVKLERATPQQARPLLENLARTAHNLKGAAAAIGLDELARLAHLVETVLQPALTNAAPLQPERVDGILLGLDAIAAQAAAMAGRTSDSPSKPLSRAFQVLESLAGAEGSAADQAPRTATVQAAPANSSTRSKETDLATVRVLTSRLEAVMNGAEELYSVRSRLECRAEEASALVRRLEACARAAKSTGADPLNLAGIREAKQLAIALANSLQAEAEVAEVTSKDLGESIRSLRTIPASGLVDAMDRLVRDHARRVGKDVALLVDGRHVEVDRFVLDELKAPLNHLLRNAVDHGIEEPAVRRSLGKPPTGVVAIGIAVVGDLLRVTVEDDGAGVALDAVRRKAVEQGLLTAVDADAASERWLIDLLFSPGFSTSAQVSETSGRGVGLDVVREAVTRLRGTVQVESQAKQGCRFTLETPLTVAATHALVVRVAEERFALPTHAVRRVRSLNREEVKVIRSQAYVSEDGELVPLDRLGSLIGMAHPADPLGARFPLVTLRIGSRAAAFAIHEYDDEAELVVKPIAEELKGMKYLQGVAMLGNGDAVLVLEPDHLVRAAEGRTGLPEPSSQTGRYTILVVDDSATTRMLHQSALEAAGFSVLTASDGESALRLLASRTFDAVVSDVRMPKMSGLDLSRAIRSSPRLQHLPLLLCTNLDRDEDKRSALASGATAFLPKSQWERGLLAQAVRAMLSGAKT